MRIKYVKSDTDYHYECECGSYISKKIELTKNPRCKQCGNRFTKIEIIVAKDKYIEESEIAR